MRRLLLLTLIATVGGAVTAPAASAGLLVQSAPRECANQVLEKPFASYGDRANYTLIRGGDFEGSLDGWRLSRAKVVKGGHGKAVKLSPGGSVTTSSVCVGLEHPTMRFFVNSSGGLLSLSTMTVEVLAESSLGVTVAVPIGVALPHKGFRPSARYLVVANLLPLLPDNYTPVAFRFRALGAASWTLDDVFVDPRRRS